MNAEKCNEAGVASSAEKCMEADAAATEKCNVAGAFHPKWFGLALQALTILAKENISTCPSGALAGYLQSEPTVLRRMLAVLAKEGLVETREGRDGGYRLVRAPETITLAEVYRILQVGAPVNYAIRESTGTHPFGQGMRTFFNELTHEMDKAVLERLAGYTIADCAARVEGCEEKSGY